MHGDARWRLEAGGAAVALVAALHEEFHFAGMHAELVLEGTAAPDRRGLLIFRHADPLAAQIGRCGDPGIGAHQYAGVEELARGEHRQRHPRRRPPRRRDHQRRHRHFGHVELGEFELPPEHFRRVDDGRREADAFRRHVAADQRPRVRIVGQRDAQREAAAGHVVTPPSARAWRRSEPTSRARISYALRGPRACRRAAARKAG